MSLDGGMYRASMGTDNQAATAKLSHEYTRRLVIVALLLLGWGLASVYDGAVRYPEQNRRRAKFDSFEKKKAADPGWKTKWKDYARSQGWEAEPPKYHSSLDIEMQFVMAVLCVPLGLGALLLFVRNRRLQFSADATGLHGFGSEVIPYSAVTAVDKRLWDDKGIAVLQVEANGRRRKVPLDDWKFAGMEGLLAEVEARLGDGRAPTELG
ncbi:MAG: hypothetical protein GW911_19485 [Armatimonadetes bacterium]|nr:hypothetical protein [Armatimonadota bacterium]NCO93595.1 hypothetical protein [Armatimonadota bacterium]NCP31278.1 hypothetical protein [Armatimonadota bacterium]NCQ26672.1 hypothetical protein [Armatimonadota bacterium]NDK14218.1 hypothetical protein [Armatimonadota bacterium]